MIKKLLLIGLGITIFAVKKAASTLQEIEEAVLASTDAESNGTEQAEEFEQVSMAVDDAAPVLDTDDLTRIKGIGPTYADRLKDAGIETFSAFAEQTPEEIIRITNARGKSTEVAEWIAQADGMA